MSERRTPYVTAANPDAGIEFTPEQAELMRQFYVTLVNSFGGNGRITLYICKGFLRDVGLEVRRTFDLPPKSTRTPDSSR